MCACVVRMINTADRTAVARGGDGSTAAADSSRPTGCTALVKSRRKSSAAAAAGPRKRPQADFDIRQNGARVAAAA